MSLWVRIKSNEDGDYYWNPEINAVGWEPPAGADVDWVGQPTDKGLIYYWNRVTRESSWEVPTLKPRQQPQGGRETGDQASTPAVAGTGPGTAAARGNAAGFMGGLTQEEGRPIPAVEVLTEVEPPRGERLCHSSPAGGPPTQAALEQSVEESPGILAASSRNGDDTLSQEVISLRNEIAAMEKALAAEEAAVAASPGHIHVAAAPVANLECLHASSMATITDAAVEGGPEVEQKAVPQKCLPLDVDASHKDICVTGETPAFLTYSRVTLHGLQVNTELNGRCGIVAPRSVSQPQDLAGTIKVRLEGGRGEVAVQAGNLEALSPGNLSCAQELALQQALEQLLREEAARRRTERSAASGKGETQALPAEEVAAAPAADTQKGAVDDNEDFIIIDSGTPASAPAAELNAPAAFATTQSSTNCRADTAPPTTARQTPEVGEADCAGAPVNTDPYAPPPAPKPRVVLLGRRALAARRVACSAPPSSPNTGNTAKPPSHLAAPVGEDGATAAATTAPAPASTDDAASPSGAAGATAPAPTSTTTAAGAGGAALKAQTPGTAAPSQSPKAPAPLRLTSKGCPPQPRNQGSAIAAGSALGVAQSEPSQRPPANQPQGVQPRPRFRYPKPQAPMPPPRDAAPVATVASVISTRPPGVASHGQQQPVTKADWCSFNAAGQRVMAPKRGASWSAGEASLPNQLPSMQQCPAGVAPQPVAVDHLGREFDLTRVVVNFANVGSTYGKRVLRRDRMVGSYLFDYEGVRRCVKYLTEKLHLGVIGVVYEHFKAVSETGQEVWEVPRDIVDMCETIELTPRITGQQHRSADDEMTIKCAFRRNCRFLDNDNYMDWRNSMHDEDVRDWLGHCQEFLQMRYFFDSGLGAFDTLDGNVPASVLAMRPAAKRPRLGGPAETVLQTPRPPEAVVRPPSID